MLRFITKEDIRKALYVIAATAKGKGINPTYASVNVSPTGEMAATDGHRCHMAQFEELPAGLYEVVKAGAKEVVLAPIPDPPQFPDYRRCVPNTEHSTTVSEELASVWKAYTQTVRAMDESLTLDYKYFSEAWYSGVRVVKVADKHQAVVFDGNGTRAIVMPCRM